MKKILFYTASNVSSVVQFGGIGALEGSQECIETFRRGAAARGAISSTTACEKQRRRRAHRRAAEGRVLRVPAHRPAVDATVGQAAATSLSWAMAEHLITHGRIGCVPGADFGAKGEGYVRFCFARDRRELAGALESMRKVLVGIQSEFRI